MNENFLIIKNNYKNELENYNDLDNLDDLNQGCHIKYFSPVVDFGSSCCVIVCLGWYVYPWFILKF